MGLVRSGGQAAAEAKKVGSRTIDVTLRIGRKFEEMYVTDQFYLNIFLLKVYRSPFAA